MVPARAARGGGAPCRRGAVLTVFYLEDRRRRPWPAGLARHQPTRRPTGVAAAFIIFGTLVAIGDFFG